MLERYIRRIEERIHIIPIEAKRHNQSVLLSSQWIKFISEKKNLCTNIPHKRIALKWGKLVAENCPKKIILDAYIKRNCAKIRHAKDKLTLKTTSTHRIMWKVFPTKYICITIGVQLCLLETISGERKFGNGVPSTSKHLEILEKVISWWSQYFKLHLITSFSLIQSILLQFKVIVKDIVYLDYQKEDSYLFNWLRGKQYSKPACSLVISKIRLMIYEFI